MVREHSVVIHRLQEVPIPGRQNKFVITENEVWFLPIEDNVSATLLAEILVQVLRIDLSDEEAVAEVDAKLEDGRILLGYVSREGRGIFAHSLPGSHNVSARRRLKEIFGTELSDAGKMGTQIEVRR